MYIVGGAKDANNYLPTITDLSCEGIFNDYFFDTEK